MTLRLDGIDVECIIGDLPNERVTPQHLLVNLELAIDECAAQSDRLSDTVDYAELTEHIRKILVESKCHLIERAARVVADACRGEAHVIGARACVVKRGSVPHLTAASAVCEWGKI